MLIFKKLPSKHFLMCFWTCSGSRACAKGMILRRAKELISHYRSHHLYWNQCSRLYISGWEAIYENQLNLQKLIGSGLRSCVSKRTTLFVALYSKIHFWYELSWDALSHSISLYLVMATVHEAPCPRQTFAEVPRLAQNLQEIVIGDEVEAREELTWICLWLSCTASPTVFKWWPIHNEDFNSRLVRPVHDEFGWSNYLQDYPTTRITTTIIHARFMLGLHY